MSVLALQGDSHLLKDWVPPYGCAQTKTKTFMFDTLRQVTRDLPVVDRRTIVHIQSGLASSHDDFVATEYALTVYVNDKEMATVVCTPQHMDEMVIGFLASEGVIRTVDQIKDLSISTYRGTARVKTTTDVNFNQEFYNKRYITSCCGKSRQSFYFHNDAHTAKRVEDDVRIRPLAVLQLIAKMDAEADLFHQTGGVHIAALCDEREVIVSRTDIGRHNALDKLYGYSLTECIPLTGKIITFSGRISSEVLLKVAKIGVGIVLAKSAPTALAIEMANELGITAVGFIRGDSMNVYTHPWRIVV